MTPILAQLKSYLTIEPTTTSFDVELIMILNTVFREVFEFGVDEYLNVEVGYDTTWPTLPYPSSLTMLIRGYVLLAAKTRFDDPANATLSQSRQSVLQSDSYRIISSIADYKESLLEEV